MKASKHLFFCSDIALQTLSSEESHHASKVLRLKVGESIKVMDGHGTIASAYITELSKNKVSFAVNSKSFHEKSKVNLHIAIAPTKSNERMAFFLEKCTEIGIQIITPIVSTNSERTRINLERWKKIVLAATKQSQSAYIPKINSIVKFKDFVNKKEHGIQLIAHCENDLQKQELKSITFEKQDICILIGPEGDFTKEEITFAIENNYKPISLGSARLRTETAGIVACHTVNLLS